MSMDTYGAIGDIHWLSKMDCISFIFEKIYRNTLGHRLLHMLDKTYATTWFESGSKYKCQNLVYFVLCMGLEFFLFLMGP